MIDIEEAERLGNAATKGPWKLTDPATFSENMRWLVEHDGTGETADAEWCVYARNHWPEILDEIRRLRIALEASEQRRWEMEMERLGEQP